MEDQVAESEWKCPPHFWIIDSYNVGHCKYCGAVKDFGKEQKAWLVGHKAAALVLSAIDGKNGKRRGRP